MSDKKVPPPLAEFAVSERAELLARIEEQAREIERLHIDLAYFPQTVRALTETVGDLRAELAALKAQPSGVVLPERKTGADASYDAYNSWNDCLDEVARLNSPAASAGVAERAAFEEFYIEKAKTLPLPLGDPIRYSGGQYINDFALFGWMVWQARAALTARPDHSAQSVPDELAKEVARIADDYHASNIEDADVALDEMREALNSALSMLAAQAPGKQEGE